MNVHTTDRSTVRLEGIVRVEFSENNGVALEVCGLDHALVLAGVVGNDKEVDLLRRVVADKNLWRRVAPSPKGTEAYVSLNRIVKAKRADDDSFESYYALGGRDGLVEVGRGPVQ